MKVIVFGGTGMVGQGVLRECLLDPGVEQVLAVGRSPLGREPHDKLHELLHRPLDDLSAVKDQLAGYDACFFCLGVSSAGMSEASFRKVTFDLTLSVARTLREVNPELSFVYVSGQGTSTKSGSMWARVKGETEDALLAMFGERGFMFRPGLIVPQHGVVTKTLLYRIVYLLLGPFFPLVRWLAPGSVTTTEAVGRGMVAVARRGFEKHVLETPDINVAGAPTPALTA
jgi:uncharacterized protein YbjT (DUF2867 family)